MSKFDVHDAGGSKLGTSDGGHFSAAGSHVPREFWAYNDANQPWGQVIENTHYPNVPHFSSGGILSQLAGSILGFLLLGIVTGSIYLWIYAYQKKGVVGVLKLALVIHVAILAVAAVAYLSNGNAVLFPITLVAAFLYPFYWVSRLG